MFGERLAENNPGGKDPIRWRGREVARIEAFSDAVFGFALTLLIVALEVPSNFDQLLLIMRGFFAFGLCFVLLFQVWYFQYRFFRRYGLNDLPTILLNATLLFVILFYVYPLKFLFNVLVMGNEHVENGIAGAAIERGQYRELMLIYGTAVVLIYALLAFMYRHALKRSTDLDLTREEIFHTKTNMYDHLLLVGVAFISILVAFLLPREHSAMAGMVYILIAPILSIFQRVRRKKALQLAEAGSEATVEAPMALDEDGIAAAPGPQAGKTDPDRS